MSASTANHSPARLARCSSTAPVCRRTARSTPAWATTIGTAPAGTARAMSPSAGRTRSSRSASGSKPSGRRPVGEVARPALLDLRRRQPLPRPDVGLAQSTVDGDRSGGEALGDDLGGRPRPMQVRRPDRCTRAVSNGRRQCIGQFDGAALADVAERRVGLTLPAPFEVPRRQPVAHAEQVGRHRHVVPPGFGGCAGYARTVAIVRMFAAAREAAGTGRDDVPGATVGEVLGAAGERYGRAFTDVLPTCRIWVNGEPPPTPPRSARTTRSPCFRRCRGAPRE